MLDLLYKLFKPNSLPRRNTNVLCLYRPQGWIWKKRQNVEDSLGKMISWSPVLYHIYIKALTKSYRNRWRFIHYNNIFSVRDDLDWFSCNRRFMSKTEPSFIKLFFSTHFKRRLNILIYLWTLWLIISLSLRIKSSFARVPFTTGNKMHFSWPLVMQCL